LLRWRIAILISVAIAISYLDRQALPVAIQAIAKDIPISNEQYSGLTSAFLLSYAFMYAGGGKLTDALGTRKGFTIIMAFWSLACMSHSLAATFTMLMVSRFLLGIGEGGGFPAATRAVSEWFTSRESSTAMGIINGGTAVGAAVATPLIAIILAFLSWRWIFIITGSFGIAWTIWWRFSYFPPAEHPRITSAERDQLRGISESSASAHKYRWIELLRIRQAWGLVIAKFLTDGAWYFYLFWLPKYLYDARGFDIKAVGMFAWIPYAASGVGCLAGGWFSSYLVQKKWGVNASRKIALGLSAAVMPSVFFIPHVAVSWAIAIFSLAYFGQQSWSTLVMIVPADLFPTNAVGAVAGLVGFGGAMGGIAFGELFGYLLDHGFGYGVVFTIAGTLHVVAFFVILAMVPAIRPLGGRRSLEYEGA